MNPLPDVSAAPVATPASAPLRVFYSGHSLMDRPMPDHVERIAQSEGRPVTWDRQYHVGSLLRQRTRGSDPAAATWTGWTLGENRDGSGLDVAAALEGRLPNVEPFEVLVTTERHDILWAMTNEGSAAYLRSLHDARVRGRPDGATWLYEGWQSLEPARVSDWIAYERASATAWQCVASEVNRTLEAAGRADRVWSLPASRALVMLVERALASPGLPGISGPDAAATLSAVFSDDVHLTPLGHYYIALVTWAFISGTPAQAGHWRPETVTEQQADSLRAVARDAHRALVSQTLATASAQACTAQLKAVCPTYWRYIETRWLAQRQSWPKARLQRLRNEWACRGDLDEGRHRIAGSA
jgi:hypothetical protein